MQQLNLLPCCPCEAEPLALPWPGYLPAARWSAPASSDGQPAARPEPSGRRSLFAQSRSAF